MLRVMFDAALCDELINHWDPNDLLDVAAGECGEFVSLIGKRAQNRLTAEDLIDETADVLNMAFLIARLIGIDAVIDRMHEKQQKTRQKMLNEKAQGSEADPLKSFLDKLIESGQEPQPR